MSRKPKPVNTSAMEHDPSESAIYRQWLDLHARWCHPGDTKMREIVAYYQHLFSPTDPPSPATVHHASVLPHRRIRFDPAYNGHRREGLPLGVPV